MAEAKTPLPCPFCAAVGSLGPHAAWYFEHGDNCWIGAQRGQMLDCVSWGEVDRWNDSDEVKQ